MESLCKRNLESVQEEDFFFLCVLTFEVCSLQLTLDVRDSKLIDGQAPYPHHHHQSKSFHDQDSFFPDVL